MSDAKRSETDWSWYYCSNQKVVLLTDANEYALSFATYTHHLAAENKRLREALDECVEEQVYIARFNIRGIALGVINKDREAALKETQ